MGFLIKKFVAGFVLPPAGLALLVLFGAVIARSRPRLARAILLVTAFMLLALSLPPTGHLLMLSLASFPPVTTPETSAEAIVMLGCGVYRDAPEFGGPTLPGYALERARYAATLQKKTGLPILVAGGDPYGDGVAEAPVMKAVLEGDYGATVKWADDASADTFENAANSARILAREGIETVYLVTHSWHMARAESLFRRHGLKVIPAPTLVPRVSSIKISSFIPDAETFADSCRALREWLGRLWYAVR